MGLEGYRNPGNARRALSMTAVATDSRGSERAEAIASTTNPTLPGEFSRPLNGCGAR